MLLTFVVGCGGNPTVSGRVTFPDGTPLDRGEVIFEGSTSTALGIIQSDGTYTMFSGELRGVPRGTYAVSIGGFRAEYIEHPGDRDNPPRTEFFPLVIPVHERFLHPSTSGLTVDVTGRTTFNITVERPE